MLFEPSCYIRACKHFIGVKKNGNPEVAEILVCKAFPNGIPDEIAYKGNEHTAPYKNDNGIRFERRI